jgi:hypothetical protein
MRTTDFVLWFLILSEFVLLLEPFERSLGSATDLSLCLIDGGDRLEPDDPCVPGLVYSRSTRWQQVCESASRKYRVLFSN